MENRLKDLRKANGYTQSQVADYLEVDQSYMSKIEKGERNLTLSILDKLSILYDCSYDYILGESDDYRIPFKSDENTDLNALSKLNQVKGYLNLLRQLEGDING